MTREEHEISGVVLKGLEERGLIESPVSSSWTTPEGVDYAWKVKSSRIRHHLTFSQPFTEDDVLRRESLVYARQQHSDVIEARYSLSREELLADLAKLYRLQLVGRPVPIPDYLDVRIRVELAPFPTTPTTISPAIP